MKKLFEKYPITKVNIIQTYLNSSDDVERRVRQRGLDGVYSYYYTEKRGKGLSRVEVEKKISKEEYLDYLMDADTKLHQIRKDRYCFVYKLSNQPCGNLLAKRDPDESILDVPRHNSLR